MRNHSPRGQSLVEFALILPVLLIFVFGIVDGARLVFAYNAVSNAAREAGRTAIVDQYLPDIRAKAAQQASLLGLPTGDPGASECGLANPTQPGTCVSFRNHELTGACASPPLVGCNAVVRVAHSFQGITPLASQLIGPVIVSSQTTQVIESVCSTAACAVR